MVSLLIIKINTYTTRSLRSKPIIVFWARGLNLLEIKFRIRIRWWVENIVGK